METQQEHTIYQYVGDNIKKYRTESKVTQEELARKINLSRVSVVNIEKGRQHASLHLLFEIAEVLKISIHNLIPQKLPANFDIQLYNQKNISENGLDKVSNFMREFGNPI